ncbi:MAG: hypothetical protein COS71_02185 [Candidatus Moranbacteria bacterium CG06_land_8_20_14_3_00_40_12]|nr:MAG: hypothetical protein COS71_02185 [Candidatus Moranbacteria bacterium CG06_land_8_20_14_3_00_40_12]
MCECSIQVTKNGKKTIINAMDVVTTKNDATAGKKELSLEEPADDPIGTCNLRPPKGGQAFF